MIGLAPVNNKNPGLKMQQISLAQYEKINPVIKLEVNGKVLAYSTPNSHTAWRVQTLFTKEPDTIAWINGFAEGCVLYDVGANVGMYTLYAAVMRGARVLAFEPESQNYGLLNKNIFSNQLDMLVQAYPVALSDAMGFDKLYLSQFIIGGSCHNFADTLDFGGRPFKPGYAQGCFAIALDQLVEQQGFPMPDHIKIDVDGIEHKVVSGAKRALESGQIKSVLIEINTNLPDHMATVRMMESLGYRWSPEQVALAQRADGAFKGIGNYIFTRA